MRYVTAAVTGGAAVLLHVLLPAEVARFVAAIALGALLGALAFPNLVAIFRRDKELHDLREAELKERQIRQAYYREPENDSTHANPSGPSTRQRS